MNKDRQEIITELKKQILILIRSEFLTLEQKENLLKILNKKDLA